MEDHHLPEMTCAIALCMSQLLQLESSEKAILSFYHIFKGENGDGRSFQSILQELKASPDGKSTIFLLYELIALSREDQSIHTNIRCDGCDMFPIVR